MPDINPRDIEIRGQYRASFPGIQRQPILGFNPKPRVYRIDPNRLPFMEAEEAAIVQFPIAAFTPSNERPKLNTEPAIERSGYIKGAGATYTTGLAEAAWATKWREKTHLNVFGHYFNTGGHIPEPRSAAF
ncbi:hypothetical protein RZS08_39565, partial [Arthrospira platensis SPKY1]|nr:hypothetical protein [Arthrospira platensis SPKY1]